MGLLLFLIGMGCGLAVAAFVTAGATRRFPAEETRLHAVLASRVELVIKYMQVCAAQTRGLQRQARLIKRLRSELAVQETDLLVQYDAHLQDMLAIARADGWAAATTGRQIVFNAAEEFLHRRWTAADGKVEDVAWTGKWPDSAAG